jgi:hypothetical protein
VDAKDLEAAADHKSYEGAMTWTEGDIYAAILLLSRVGARSNAPNYISEANTSALGPAATITFSSAQTIAKVKSGIIRVRGHMCPTGSIAGADAVLTLLRDGITTLPPVAKSTVISGSNASHSGDSVEWIDTLPDSAAHTYTISAAGSTGTLSDGIEHATITANEL